MYQNLPIKWRRPKNILATLKAGQVWKSNVTGLTYLITRFSKVGDDTLIFGWLVQAGGELGNMELVFDSQDFLETMTQESQQAMPKIGGVWSMPGNYGNAKMFIVTEVRASILDYGSKHMVELDVWDSIRGTRATIMTLEHFNRVMLKVENVAKRRAELLKQATA